MRRLLLILSAAIISIIFHGVALTQEGEIAAPKCPEDSVPLPAELTAWTHQIPLLAATRKVELGKATIVVGQAVLAEMKTTSMVRYVARPANPGGKVSRGGMFQLAVKQPGLYRVAISDHSWIDLVSQGQLIPSTRHGRGPACSGIRKMVDYRLQTGSYTLQLSAGEQDNLGILVVFLADDGKN